MQAGGVGAAGAPSSREAAEPAEPVKPRNPGNRFVLNAATGHEFVLNAATGKKTGTHTHSVSGFGPRNAVFHLPPYIFSGVSQNELSFGKKTYNKC